MKVKVLCRNPDDYLRETKRDIQRGEAQITLVLIIKRRFFSCFYLDICYEKTRRFIRSCASSISMAAQFAFVQQILLCKMLSDEWIVTMLLHQPGPQLKLPAWRNKSIYAISV